jgi:hypothetical protein
MSTFNSTIVYAKLTPRLSKVMKMGVVEPKMQSAPHSFAVIR